MGTFRQFPVSMSAIAICLIAAVGLAWRYRGDRAQANRLQQRLENERHEWRAMEAMALIAAKASRDRAADADRARRTRRALLATLARSEAALLAGAPMPGSRTEACAALAGMAHRLRELAIARGIAVSPEEGFGFAEFAQAGPEPGRLAEVHRQSLVVTAVVRLLIAAEPAEIRAVRRGKEMNAVDGLAGTGGSSLSPDRSLRVHGLAGSTEIRVEFTGRTDVLRDFLNDLARSELLPAVRSVEVKPIQRAAPVSANDPAATWVASELMEFAVTLECVQLEPAAVAELAAGPVAEVDVPTSACWSRRAEAKAGTTHCDLFTAPTVLYDPASGEFVVTRFGDVPVAPRAEVDQPAAVAAVPRQPYRIQLLGYIGAGAEGVGTFADLTSGATFLARAGQTVPGSAITVRTLRRMRRPPGAEASARAQGWVTVAEIEDSRTGERTTLTDAMRTETEVVR